MEKKENFQIVPYEIEKHGSQVLALYDKYIVPESCKRMGIKAEERNSFCYIEDVLTVNAVFDEKFSDYSFVVIDSSGKVRGAQLAYLLDKATLKTDIAVKEQISKHKQHSKTY